MKKIILGIAIILMVMIMPVRAEELPKVTDHEKIVIYMFRGKTCTACHQALANILNLGDKYDDYVEFKTYEVWYVKDNSTLLNDVIKDFKVDEKEAGVPFFVVGDKYFVGYKTAMFEEALKLYEDKNYTDSMAKRIEKSNLNLEVKTVKEAAIDAGILKEENNNTNEEKDNNKYDVLIIIGIFAIVIGGFIGLVVVSNKK